MGAHVNSLHLPMYLLQLSKSLILISSCFTLPRSGRWTSMTCSNDSRPSFLTARAWSSTALSKKVRTRVFVCYVSLRLYTFPPSVTTRSHGLNISSRYVRPFLLPFNKPLFQINSLSAHTAHSPIEPATHLLVALGAKSLHFVKKVNMLQLTHNGYSTTSTHLCIPPCKSPIQFNHTFPSQSSTHT